MREENEKENLIITRGRRKETALLEVMVRVPAIVHHHLALPKPIHTSYQTSLTILIFYTNIC